MRQGAWRAFEHLHPPASPCPAVQEAARAEAGGEGAAGGWPHAARSLASPSCRRDAATSAWRHIDPRRGPHLVHELVHDCVHEHVPLVVHGAKPCAQATREGDVQAHSSRLGWAFLRARCAPAGLSQAPAHHRTCMPQPPQQLSAQEAEETRSMPRTAAPQSRAGCMPPSLSLCMRVLPLPAAERGGLPGLVRHACSHALTACTPGGVVKTPVPSLTPWSHTTCLLSRPSASAV